MKKLFTLFVLMIPLCASAFENYGGYGYGGGYNDGCCCDPCGCDGLGFDCNSGWLIQGRIAGFRPNSKRFRQIYDSWGVQYQLQIDKKFNYSCYDLAAFVNVGWYTEKGHARRDRRDNSDFTVDDITPNFSSEDISGEGRRRRHGTRVDLVPVTFGLKYFYPIYCNIDAYLGLGAAATWIKTRDHGDCVRRNISKTGWGGVVKGGFIYTFCDCFFVDIFADWIFCCRVDKSHRHRNRDDSISPEVSVVVVDDSGEGRRRRRNNSVDVGGLTLGAGLGFKF